MFNLLLQAQKRKICTFANRDKMTYLIFKNFTEKIIKILKNFQDIPELSLNMNESSGVGTNLGIASNLDIGA